jgi:hypothetical protein
MRRLTLWIVATVTYTSDGYKKSLQAALDAAPARVGP